VSALATAECTPRALLGAAGGEPMLDEVLVGVWEGLTAHQAVACPVCCGEMKRELGIHRGPIIGRCGTCGATVA
jgi:hypothetical protein